MSNELNSTKLLVCPSDASKQPATGFGKLQAGNVTYLIRSGTNIDETNPEEVLVRCPVHGHVGLCDGTVKKAFGKRE